MRSNLIVSLMLLLLFQNNLLAMWGAQISDDQPDLKSEEPVSPPSTQKLTWTSIKDRLDRASKTDDIQRIFDNQKERMKSDKTPLSFFNFKKYHDCDTSKFWQDCVEDDRIDVLFDDQKNIVSFALIEEVRDKTDTIVCINVHALVIDPAFENNRLEGWVLYSIEGWFPGKNIKLMIPDHWYNDEENDDCENLEKLTQDAQEFFIQNAEGSMI